MLQTNASVRECVSCHKSFAVTRGWQKRCDDCTDCPCPDCGGKKYYRSKKCLECTRKLSLGRPKRKPITEDDIAHAAESVGLLEENQQAFGYVIGVVFGDGSISTGTSKPYVSRITGQVSELRHRVFRIRLQVKSEAFACKFASSLGVLLGRAPNVWPCSRTFGTSSLPGMPAGLTLKLFNVSQAHRIFGPYLHQMKYTLPCENLLRFPDAVCRGIVDGMIDSEGSICVQKRRLANGGHSLHPRLEVANSNRSLLEVLQAMLARLGFHSFLGSASSPGMYRLYMHKPERGGFHKTT